MLKRSGYLGFAQSFEVPEKVENFPRFSMLICSMFCSVVVGVIYAFSLISTRLSVEYKYSQNDITTISTVGAVMGYFVFPFGVLYDYFGAKPIFLLGIVFNVLGTVLFAMTFRGAVPHSVAGLSVFNAILNIGCGLFDLAGIMTVLSWFPLDRGLVVTCIATATGLGGSVVSTLYGTYFAGEEESYMFLLMGYSLVVGVVALVVMYLPPFHMTGQRARNFTEDDHARAAQYQSLYMRNKGPVKRFAIAFGLICLLTVLICARSIIFVFIKAPTHQQMSIPTVLMIVLYLLLVLALLPIKWLDANPRWYDRGCNATAHQMAELLAEADNDDELSGSSLPREEGEAAAVAAAGAKQQQQQHGNRHELAAAAPGEALPEAAQSGTPAEPASLGDELPPSDDAMTRNQVVEALRRCEEAEKIFPQYHTSFWRNCLRPQLWCMWVTAFCVSGAVNVVLFNSTQIYNAISEDPNDYTRASLYVALTSVGSAVGRIIMAMVEVRMEAKAPEERLPITVFYPLAPSFCALSMLLFLFIPAAGLIVPMLLAGLANGVYAAVFIITVRTVFAIDVAKLYNSCYIFEMLAMIFMNRLLFGEIMTKNSAPGADGQPVCYGRKKCVQTTFIVLVCLSALGVITSVFAHLTYLRYARREMALRKERKKLLVAQLHEDVPPTKWIEPFLESFTS